MSDPRNVAHAKKVTQEKKHHGSDAGPGDSLAAQRGKKPAAPKNKSGPAGSAVVSADTAVVDTAAPGDGPAATPPVALESSLTVLAKLKEMEFYSRANLERLAELSMTVEDELKQKEIVGPLAEVSSAQNVFQTKLTTLIELYKAECDRMQGGRT